MASATRSRFGFHDRSSSSESMVSTTSPPGRGTIVDNAPSSAIRGMSDWNESFEFREDPSFWKDHNVQVIIRIRPLSSSEVSLQGHSKCIRQESSQTLTWTGHPESRFTFDLVADENVTQENLFKVAGVPMVENCVGGYNSCMFAYGQTGSGKTHTMLGDIEGGTRRHSVNAGMTPRVFEYLFSRIQKEKEARKEEKIRFTCKCSFLEIYNEQILDLLDPSSNNLQIREDIKKGIHVENIKEIEVSSARDVMQQLIQGAANRKVAATNMNRASSRSHSVFTCIIESKWESQGVNHHRFARLNLVDLAGSERQKSSGAEGERLKEATNINKSLSTLGLVIMNLVNISNGKSQHVPYRDSKLTFLLQDSLGGNSKTIIIANITPSTGCSLETLSTLKFAQRAKFIKNNAIVNEDASGDVIGMRMQIQQLKKEVSHLQGLLNGGTEDLVNDMSTISCPGSPVSFKWQGLNGNGSFSPLTSDKSIAKNDAALLGALRREKQKDITLEALAAESQAALQLAKQREDEIQGLKMRLRLREAGIKRLEQVSSGKISAETHLLKEREEFLKEIEVLRSQVSRNQEVTRFAMENLRLKDEIRRLKAFCEEGERETMNEEIMALRYKLLEALDWKLMHEKDTNESPDKVSGSKSDGNMPISGQEESAWCSRLNEENEFLRMQAIQNRSEMEALQKKIGSCFEEKEKLERYVNDLLQKIEQERSSTAAKEKLQQMDSHSQLLVHASDQIELKTMVDAIAAATSREAEALSRVFKLSQENDELRLKLKGCVEDNKHLLELYERKAAEITHTEAHANHTLVHDAPSEERDFEIKKVVEDLEQQLAEMHEENDKLMGLYEKAMQERDELKRMLCSSAENSSEPKTLHCPEKLINFHAEECLKRDDEPVCIISDDLDNQTFDRPEKLNDFHAEERLRRDDEADCIMSDDLDNQTDTWNPHSSFTDTHAESLDFAHMRREDLNHVREELENAQKKLSLSSKNVVVYNSLVRALLEVEKLSSDIEALEGCIQEKQVDFEAAALLCSDAKERRNVISNKLSALKSSLLKISSSVSYFVQRETRARHRLDSSLSYLEKKKAELAYLQNCKEAMETSKSKIKEAEVDERSNLARLKLKLEEENRRQENEKVLFPIDNMEKNESLRLHLCGKATELLKSEEEKNMLQNEIKLSREKLVMMKMEFEDLDKKVVNLENELHYVKECVEKGTKAVEDMKLALQGVTEEKETLFTVRGDGEAEIESMIIEYHQQVFETDLREAEMEIIDKEMQVDQMKMEQLRAARTQVSLKLKQLLGNGDDSSWSSNMEVDLQEICLSIKEATMLLLQS